MKKSRTPINMREASNFDRKIATLVRGKSDEYVAAAFSTERFVAHKEGKAEGRKEMAREIAAWLTSSEATGVHEDDAFTAKIILEKWGGP